MNRIVHALGRSAGSVRAGSICWLALVLVASVTGGGVAFTVGVAEATAARGTSASGSGINTQAAATSSTSTARTDTSTTTTTTTPTDTTPTPTDTTTAPTDTTTTPTDTTPGSTTGGTSPDSEGVVSPTNVEAVSSSFVVEDQKVAVAFPVGSVSYSFELPFSTSRIANSTALRLRFKSAAIYLGKGVKHTWETRRRGRTVRMTTYLPNAKTDFSRGTLTVDLSDVHPGSYTCKLQLNYLKTVPFHGLKVTLPYTTDITEAITVIH